jgi:hypothetical protein
LHGCRTAFSGLPVTGRTQTLNGTSSTYAHRATLHFNDLAIRSARSVAVVSEDLDPFCAFFGTRQRRSILSSRLPAVGRDRDQLGPFQTPSPCGFVSDPRAISFEGNPAIAFAINIGGRPMAGQPSFAGRLGSRPSNASRGASGQKDSNGDYREFHSQTVNQPCDVRNNRKRTLTASEAARTYFGGLPARR